jgi:hypothetical protein
LIGVREEGEDPQVDGIVVDLCYRNTVYSFLSSRGVEARNIKVIRRGRRVLHLALRQYSQ